MGEDEAAARPPVPGPGLLNNRLVIVAMVASGAIFLILAFFLIRFSFPTKGEEFTKILAYLSAKEAASIVVELKNLKIPYKLEDKGATVLVPKNRADEARLGLAAKSLPAGGAVGFEIFDKTGLGTTDFDRRIKFVRALSGELSRNISQMEGVEEARVQIVIPETQLFASKKSPVTASVLLRLKRSANLMPEQVNGIVHLVASSVEDLKPENVTIVDINGYILSGPKVAKIPAKEKITELPPEVLGEQVVVPGEEAKKTALHEDIIEQLNYKDELEKRFTDKAQDVLNQIYLPDVARVWVNAELGPTKKAPSEKGPAETRIPWEIKNINAVILINDVEKLTQKTIPFEKLKQNTFNLVSSAIGYNRTRGDKIEMRRVPFTARGFQPLEETQIVPGGAAHEVSAAVPGIVKEVTQEPVVARPAFFQKIILFFIGGVVLLRDWLGFLFATTTPITFKIVGLSMILLVFGAVVWWFFLRKAKPKEEEIKIGREAAEEKIDLAAVPEVQKIREAAQAQPEKLASVLKTWLAEEGGGG